MTETQLGGLRLSVGHVGLNDQSDSSSPTINKPSVRAAEVRHHLLSSPAPSASSAPAVRRPGQHNALSAQKPRLSPSWIATPICSTPPRRPLYHSSHRFPSKIAYGLYTASASHRSFPGRMIGLAGCRSQLVMPSFDRAKPIRARSLSAKPM